MEGVVGRRGLGGLKELIEVQMEREFVSMKNVYTKIE